MASHKPDCHLPIPSIFPVPEVGGGGARFSYNDIICVYNTLDKFELFSFSFDCYLIGLDIAILTDHTPHSRGQGAKSQESGVPVVMLSGL